MAYAPSPRPTFDGPAHIPYAAVTRHLWGDVEAGEVADWIYVSSDKIHQLVFGLNPGRAFRHSDSFRTIFAADEILYVLSGLMVIANPERGEVHRVQAGEAVFFRRDTWHHAFNYGSEPLRVLEFFAPPPSQGTSGAYARTKPNLVEINYIQNHLLGQWPMSRDQIMSNFSMQVMREADLLWRMEGRDNPILVGLWAATEYLTVGQIYLMPGQQSDVQQHAGDESLYVIEGTLNMRLPDNDGQRWFELNPKDGFYIPQGVPHHYYNISDQPVRLIFGVAPTYLPNQPDD